MAASVKDAIHVSFRDKENRTFSGILNLQNWTWMEEGIPEPPVVGEKDADDDATIADPNGASYYVIAVILVYGISIVLLIATHIKRKHAKLLEDRQIDKYLREFQVVKEKSSRDSYKNLKKMVVARLDHEPRKTHKSLTQALFPVMAVSLAAKYKVEDLQPDHSNAQNNNGNNPRLGFDRRISLPQILGRRRQSHDKNKDDFLVSARRGRRSTILVCDKSNVIVGDDDERNSRNVHTNPPRHRWSASMDIEKLMQSSPRSNSSETTVKSVRFSDSIMRPPITPFSSCHLDKNVSSSGTLNPTQIAKKKKERVPAVGGIIRKPFRIGLEACADDADDASSDAASSNTTSIGCDEVESDKSAIDNSDSDDELWITASKVELGNGFSRNDNRQKSTVSSLIPHQSCQYKTVRQADDFRQTFDQSSDDESDNNQLVQVTCL